MKTMPRYVVLAMLLVAVLGAGCRKRKRPPEPTEGPDDKAKHLAEQLSALVKNRDAEVANCVTIVFDAAKKTIIDPTDYANAGARISVLPISYQRGGSRPCKPPVNWAFR